VPFGLKSPIDKTQQDVYSQEHRHEQKEQEKKKLFLYEQFEIKI
jgi:hypothetical protein